MEILVAVGLLLIVGGIALAGLSLALGILVWAIAIPIAVVKALVTR